MRPTAPIAGTLIAGLLLTSCAMLTRTGQPTAQAVMQIGSGISLGVLSLTPTGDGVRITGTLKGLAYGVHGIHIHAVGKCDAPAFTTAGSHFNPSGMKHGLQNPAGPHAGDMSNITANDAGEATVNITNPRVTLDGMAPTGVFDADGSAIVIHAAADDQTTDPSGNSGSRVACGVITRL